MKSLRIGTAFALFLALAACSTTDSIRSDDASRSDSASSSSETSGMSSQAQTPTSSQAGSAMAQQQQQQTQQQMQQHTNPSTSGVASTWSAPADANAVVTTVELVPRSSSDVGSGTVAGAAVGGTTAGSDRVYRITLRLDDGSSRTVTQESAPSFRSGDRVRVNNDGMIQQH